MTWIDHKDSMDTSGGCLRRPRSHRILQEVTPPEPTYSVAEFAAIFAVDKRTVYKWLMIEDGDAVIPPDLWFKLPGTGYIRIRHRAIEVIEEG